MKLYADEAGAAEAREWSTAIITGSLAVTEVVAALWGQVERQELGAEHAAILDRAFRADLHDGRFVVAAIDDACIEQSLHVIRRHRLRGADALQLGTALALRAADPALTTLAAFDAQLRAAAAAESFALLPPT